MLLPGEMLLFSSLGVNTNVTDCERGEFGAVLRLSERGTEEKAAVDSCLLHPLQGHCAGSGWGPGDGDAAPGLPCREPTALGAAVGAPPQSRPNSSMGEHLLSNFSLSEFLVHF